MVADVQATPAFLATARAGTRESRLALATVLVSAAFFLGAAPFAKVQLASVPAFIPIYESLLADNDVITAILLFGQFAILRSPSLLVIASGYFFTALMAAFHALSFPGLFSPTGLLGAGTQTTAWIYLFWHTAFPVFVISYAALKDRDIVLNVQRARLAIALSGAAVLAIACTFTYVAVAGNNVLPPILENNHYSTAAFSVAVAAWSSCIVALVILWRRKPHSLLDIWLIVVLCAWIFDVALSLVLNHGRFDVGFYLGRIYGLLATSFVLWLLLIENGVLYSWLVAVQRDLARLASVDPLTGIANRRTFADSLDREWRRILRDGNPLSMLMIDIDHFKRYNDRYGHAAGDVCLRSVAEAIAGAARRAGDVVARYGGEEFVAILPGADLTVARALAERIVDAVRALGIPHVDSETAEHVTISVGVATIGDIRANRAGDVRQSVLIEASDAALYAAKKSGRNCVCVNSPSLGSG